MHEIFILINKFDTNKRKQKSIHLYSNFGMKDFSNHSSYDKHIKSGFNYKWAYFLK